MQRHSPLYPAPEPKDVRDTCSSITDWRQQQDDEFEKPYLAGFEWDPEEDYTRFIVHQTNTPTSSFTKDPSNKKKKKAKAEDAEE